MASQYGGFYDPLEDSQLQRAKAPKPINYRALAMQQLQAAQQLQDLGETRRTAGFAGRPVATAGLTVAPYNQRSSEPYRPMPNPQLQRQQYLAGQPATGIAPPAPARPAQPALGGAPAGPVAPQLSAMRGAASSAPQYPDFATTLARYQSHDAPIANLTPPLRDPTGPRYEPRPAPNLTARWATAPSPRPPPMGGGGEAGQRVAEFSQAYPGTTTLGDVNRVYGQEQTGGGIASNQLARARLAQQFGGEENLRYDAFGNISNVAEGYRAAADRIIAEREAGALRNYQSDLMAGRGQFAGAGPITRAGLLEKFTGQQGELTKASQAAAASAAEKLYGIQAEDRRAALARDAENQRAVLGRQAETQRAALSYDLGLQRLALDQQKAQLDATKTPKPPQLNDYSRLYSQALDSATRNPETLPVGANGQPVSAQDYARTQLESVLKNEGNIWMNGEVLPRQQLMDEINASAQAQGVTPEALIEQLRGQGVILGL